MKTIESVNISFSARECAIFFSVIDLGRLWSIILLFAGADEPLLDGGPLRMSAVSGGLWAVRGWSAVRRFPQLGDAHRHTGAFVRDNLLPAGGRDFHLEVRQRQGEQANDHASLHFVILVDLGTRLVIRRLIGTSSCVPWRLQSAYANSKHI